MKCIFVLKFLLWAFTYLDECIIIAKSCSYPILFQFSNDNKSFE